MFFSNSARAKMFNPLCRVKNRGKALNFVGQMI
ncbi:hypothetical protein UNH65_10210 [Chitinophaga sp. 180180018-2]|nr:hypothetical protein [Chitinophaga sp. 212800010-3]